MGPRSPLLGPKRGRSGPVNINEKRKTKQMTSKQYYERANSARVQAAELHRQADHSEEIAKKLRKDGNFNTADAIDAEVKKLRGEALAMTREANRLFLISKGELEETATR